jgi:CheY-like chemotaxis protein
MISLFKANKKEPTKFSILVVSDNAETLPLITTQFEAAGHQVYVAENGLSAIQLLDVMGMPDLLITDFQNPASDGKIFMDKARIRFGKTALPPVLFLVASKEDETIAGQMEVYDVFPKTFDGTLLLDHACMLCEGRKVQFRDVL